nr:quinone-dependent dihydroorotate dehydrogenase [Beijerinckia indica]
MAPHRLLFGLDPERAHRLAIWALAHVPLPPPPAVDPRLSVEAFGLAFANPLGLAAGMDKNGEAPGALLRLGFGFAEIGTVTPLPQPGNPLPRLFRLTKDEAIINRFGFNSEGHARVHERLTAFLAGARRKGVIGINIGANKDSLDRAEDYVKGIHAFADCADYFTINISSPNTPALRDLQQPLALDDLVVRALAARDAEAERHGRKPVLVKIAPDLTLSELDAIVKITCARKVDGLIVSNTTLSRPSDLQDPQAREAGGLSGKPLFDLSTRMLAETFVRVENQFPLIGVGGIDSAETALAKIEAGATLVQLYSGLVFQGPGLVRRILGELPRLLTARNYPRLVDAVGAAAVDRVSEKI